MVDIYVMMCDKCFDGMHIGGSITVTKSEGEDWSYNRVCEVCGKNVHNTIVRCRVVKRDGSKYKLEILGMMKQW